MEEARRPCVGIALGAGSARGWAHIGVLKALQAQGIHPEVVVGTSIGALVGASYVAGNLDELQHWVSKLTWQQVVGYLDPHFSGGLIAGRKLFEFFRGHFADRIIDDLPLRYSAVSTDLETGQEIWLQRGSLLEAVRASVALPGLMTPVYREGRWLLDGGLVNPVPVSVCRALGAEVIIAVDLNADLLQKHRITRRGKPKGKPGQNDNVREQGGNPGGDFRDFLRQQVSNVKASLWRSDATPEVPSLIDIVLRSVNIMQVRITRSRMAGEPPELVIAPRLSHISLMEFHRAKEAIDEGYRTIERMADEMAQVRELL